MKINNSQNFNDSMKEITITDIQGIKIGHSQNFKAATGCTVVLCENGAVAGVDVRGGAPASRETELLNPVNMIEQIHAVVLSGGSAFGLDSASGVMEYLEENKIGFDVQITRVPIVCAASLFDLYIGDWRIRPDKKMGYEACRNATIEKSPEGNIGAGTGASVGKILGMERAMKSGLGIYGLQIGELKVASIVAVNCLGDVLDPDSQEKVAGLLDETRTKIIDTEEVIYKNFKNKKNLFSSNTTIGVVATNGKFTKAQINKIASMSHNGFARTIRPTHSMYDGDTVFAVSTCEADADINTVGSLAAFTMAKAIFRAATLAEGRYGLKASRDLR